METGFSTREIAMRVVYSSLFLVSASAASAAQFEFKNYPAELVGRCSITSSSASSRSDVGYLTLQQHGNRLFYRFEIGRESAGFVELVDRDVKTTTSKDVSVSAAVVSIDKSGFVTRESRQYFEGTCHQAYSERIVFSGGGSAVNVDRLQSVGHVVSRDKTGKEVCRYDSAKVQCSFDGKVRSAPFPFPTK